MRPDRSDAHPSPEEEAKKEEEARKYFQGVTPKRHTKPSRSDHSSVYSDKLKPSHEQQPIPELGKFQDLEAHTEKLVCEGSGAAVEEYVETEYYSDLNCVDKQHHHTTGTGYIKTENSGSFRLNSDAAAGDSSHPSSKGNPTTNEWVPTADPAVTVSSKPNRSDV